MIDVTQGRVLIVDDQETHIVILQRMLAHAGFANVCSTTDPREAADFYQAFAPDVVLLDLHMRPIDGFAVLEELHRFEAGGYVPVLMMSALDDSDTMSRALRAGARDFIRKPFEQFETMARIRNMIEVRLLHNEVRAQNRNLERTIDTRTRELRETRLDVIRRLGRAAEYRDNETGMHIIRMSLSARRLAEAAGMSFAECETVLNASPMHDIGKIGVPDRILLKPGKLNAEEWEVMKQHSAIGASLLSGSHSELMQMAEQIAHCHHERWDGTGYPRSMRGEEIPVVARICAICDVFDALLSRRPYKEPWPLDAALAEIYRLSGTHFDPSLVEMFRDSLDDIVAIQSKYADREA